MTWHGMVLLDRIKGDTIPRCGSFILFIAYLEDEFRVWIHSIIDDTVSYCV